MDTNNISTRNGLLYRDGEMINLPEADNLARAAGFQHAEQYVKQLEKDQAARAERIAEGLDPEPVDTSYTKSEAFHANRGG